MVVGIPIGFLLTLVMIIVSPFDNHWTLDSPTCKTSLDGKYRITLYGNNATIRGFVICPTGPVTVDENQLPLYYQAGGWVFRDNQSYLLLDNNFELIELQEWDFNGQFWVTFEPRARV